MAKGYRWLVDLVCSDDSFTPTILFVIATATVFAFAFDAPVEIVVGMIGLGCTTAVIEYRIWTNEHRRK